MLIVHRRSMQFVMWMLMKQKQAFALIYMYFDHSHNIDLPVVFSPSLFPSGHSVLLIAKCAGYAIFSSSFSSFSLTMLLCLHFYVGWWWCVSSYYCCIAPTTNIIKQRIQFHSHIKQKEEKEEKRTHNQYERFKLVQFKQMLQNNIIYFVLVFFFFCFVCSSSFCLLSFSTSSFITFGITYIPSKDIILCEFVNAIFTHNT